MSLVLRPIWVEPTTVQLEEDERSHPGTVRNRVGSVPRQREGIPERKRCERGDETGSCVCLLFLEFLGAVHGNGVPRSSHDGKP